MAWRGFGFVHRSRTLFCRAVPNLSITIRNFFIAVPLRSAHPAALLEPGISLYCAISGLTVGASAGWGAQEMLRLIRQRSPAAHGDAAAAGHDDPADLPIWSHTLRLHPLPHAPQVKEADGPHESEGKMRKGSATGGKAAVEAAEADIAVVAVPTSTPTPSPSAGAVNPTGNPTVDPLSIRIRLFVCAQRHQRLHPLSLPCYQQSAHLC
jgi:hypothetical protein